MKIGAYSDIKKITVWYFECPNCGHLTESLETYNRKYECSECKHHFSECKTIGLKRGE